MEKIPLVKKKGKLYYQWFSLGVSSASSGRGWGILYPKHFHQSHICMHIKEGCITACVNYSSY